MACVAVAIGWSGYFNNILKLCGLELAYWATHPPVPMGIANIRPQSSSSSSQASSLSESKKAQRATCGIVLVKLPSLCFSSLSGVHPSTRQTGLRSCHSDLPAWGAAAAIVFFAYIGFDAVSTTAEEAKNPQRDLPIGIFASWLFAHCSTLRWRRS